MVQWLCVLGGGVITNLRELPASMPEKKTILTALLCSGGGAGGGRLLLR